MTQSAQFWMPSLQGSLSADSLPIFSRESGVVHLLRACRPSNIARLITAVVIDAVQRQFGIWSLAYRGKEGFKTGAPFIADANASSAVVAVFRTIRVVTSALDSGPQAVLGNRAQPVSARCIADQASAGLGLTCSQAADENNLFGAARAAAQQVSQFAVSTLDFADHSPASNHGSWGNRANQSVNNRHFN